jgi:chaperonin GroES
VTTTFVPRPVHDRIIVRRLPAVSTTPGGLFIPEQGREKPCRGEVLAVGPGRTDLNRDGLACRAPVCCVPGDIVLFGKYSGTETHLNGEDILIIGDADVLAIELEARNHPTSASDRVVVGGFNPMEGRAS